MLILNEIPLIILAGAIGALASELLIDNCIEVPKKVGARFSLGIIGSMLIGAIAGYYIDGSAETAFMAGFIGPQFLRSILKKKLGDFGEIEDEKTAKNNKTQDIGV